MNHCYRLLFIGILVSGFVAGLRNFQAWPALPLVCGLGLVFVGAYILIEDSE